MFFGRKRPEDEIVARASDASAFTMWIMAGGSTGSIGVDAKVSDGSNMRYVFASWGDGSTSNPSHSTQMNAPKTLTATYNTQYKITFSQSGVGNGFSGTVVNVDGAKYSQNKLPTSFWWDKNSVHTFQFVSPLTVGRRSYVWSSTTGLSNLQTGTITVSTSGIVTGIYK